MLSKCANPNCGVPFRYLKEGTVFIAEWANAGDACELTDPARALTKRWGHREMFWLCTNCSDSLTLITKGRQVVAAPREQILKNDERLLRPLKIAV
jgi:hypothetical protein